LTIHHILIAFHIHNGYRSVGENRMHNIRSVPLALQFPLSKGFKPRIVEEDLISFKLLLFQSFIIPPFDSLFVYACIFICFQPHLL
jgi:hypothetical protein